MKVHATRSTEVAEGLDFEEFFRAEFPALVRGLFLLVPDRAEAEELAQDAMARVFERWDRVRTMESPGGYAFQTAVNLNRRRLRRMAVGARKLRWFRAGTERSPDHVHELQDAIAALSQGQREAFLLVEWLGMSSEEAGHILRIAPGSVRSRVHRAKEVLRLRLWNEEE